MTKSQKSTPTPLSGEMTIIYEGPREASFSVNSQVYWGRKIRVERNVPFVVNAGDKFIATLPDFREIKEDEPPQIGYPSAPPTPPEIQLDVPVPAPVISAPEPTPEPKSDGFMVLENIKRLNLSLLVEAGFDSLDKIRADFATNGGLGIAAIKGVGPATLEHIKEIVVG